VNVPPVEAEPLHRRTPSAIDRIAKRLLTGKLSGLKRGEIQLCDAQCESRLGEPGSLQVRLEVHNSRFYRDVLCGGALSVAESYLRGDWDCEDLTSLFRIFVRNMDATARMSGGLARAAGLVSRLYHWWHSNSPGGSKKNISAHYDLGNEFFRLWLDETLTYSSGIFPGGSASLHEASLEKIDRICRKLQLQPGDELLEIGSGWGAMAIHAAENYGCNVTTTTISQEQHRLVRDRINAAGLSRQITLLNRDYRDLTGQFDKLVSVEMVEAVGHRYLDDYLRQCSRLLRPEGTFVLQAIVLPERGYAQYLQNVDFIQRYVFPGGCLPTVGSLLESAGRATDLRIVHVEDFAPHYARTLRCWKQAFLERSPEIVEQGFSTQFMRMWMYYLCYCEAVFDERYCGVAQMQFDKPLCRRDPIQLSALASTTRPARSTTTVAPSNHPVRSESIYECHQLGH
jgi:cyclopropane-fatty-acyl-phospholipid synthase